MPLNKSLFEKNIAGNQAHNTSNGVVAAAVPPRRKWGKTASTPAASMPSASSEPAVSKPKWGGSHLKKTNTTNSSTTSGGTSNPFGATLKKIPSKEPSWKKPPNNAVESVPEPTQEEPEPSPEPTPEPTPDPEPTKETISASTDISSTVTESTADLTERMEASGETKLESNNDNNKDNSNSNDVVESDKEEKEKEGPAHDWAASASTLNLDSNQEKEKDKDSKKKDKKSKKKDKKNDKGSAFALDPKEYLPEVPPEKRTKGKFDWSGVQSVINSIILDKKIEKKRDKLKEKLNNINATREDALKMMQEHVTEQKKKLDESKEKSRRKMYEMCGGMSYNEMVEKVKENHEIVATLKKSNNKLRQDTQKMMLQVKNLRVNNMKLEAANEQSEKVLEQLKERKKAVDARYEHLTKVIIPPYQERIKEMEDVVEERKLYGRNEHRTKIRYGNYIIRFLDKVDRSDESERFKTMIFEMGQHVEGGNLAELGDDSSESDEEIQLEEIPALPKTMNESFRMGNMHMANHKTEHNDDDNDNDQDNNDGNDGKKNLASSKNSTEEKSLWDRYGSGGGSNSKSGGMNASSGSLGGNAGKNADLLKKASQAKANNFNGAVILSDSSSDDDSDSDDDDDDDDDDSDSS